jgi:hypothetical protein
MFFRRERPKNFSFSERIDSLRKAGFAVAQRNGGVARVSRDGLAVDLKDASGTPEAVAPAGVVVGDEIGALVDGGYQKFFRTPSGKKKPALADELKALHDFEEDVKEGLGLKSLYNQSLGTVSTYYLYDRVKDRDSGHIKRVWD